MAALFGRLNGNRGEVTRLGSKDSGIKCTLQTWKGKVVLCLEADGTWNLYSTDINATKVIDKASGKVPA